MNDNNKFKNRLKELRKEFEMTQQDLANKIGIVRTAIANYETGRTIPDSETLSIIAKIFKTTMDYLLGNSDIRNPYLVKEDEREYGEVDDVEDAMKIILKQPGLMLKGELLSDESKIILANAIQMGLRTAEELEKKKQGDKDE